MTKDHKIRILVSGLKGAAREAEILKLLTHPKTINYRLMIRLKMLGR